MMIRINPNSDAAIREMTPHEEALYKKLPTTIRVPYSEYGTPSGHAQSGNVRQRYVGPSIGDGYRSVAAGQWTTVPMANELPFLDWPF